MHFESGPLGKEILLRSLPTIVSFTLQIATKKVHSLEYV